MIIENGHIIATDKTGEEIGKPIACNQNVTAHTRRNPTVDGRAISNASSVLIDASVEVDFIGCSVYGNDGSFLGKYVVDGVRLNSFVNAKELSLSYYNE